MSHLVALTAPQSAAHTVKRYPGFGILGADIPATGDNGGSPVLNDGVLPGSEYHWRVVTPPSSGTLTIYPDLSFELVGAADGDWTWQYRLFEDGTDQGVATVNIHVGAYAVTVADSQQLNTASAAAIRQTHLLGIASSQQANQSSTAAIRQTHLISAANSQQVNAGVAASVSQSSITFVSAADSIQINTADAAAIRQTHLVGVASSQQANIGSAASISQSSITFVSTADSIQINQADAAAIRQTHLVGVASSQQINTASAAAIAQTASGSILVADSQQINQASAGSILQMHRVSVADSQQINRASAGRVSDGTQPIGATVASLIASVRPATRLGVAVSPVNALLREVDLSNFYYKGGAVRLHVRVAGNGDVDFDPAVLTLKTRFDSGLVTVLTYGIDPEIVRDRVGRYHADLDLLDSGTFHFRWETAAPAGAAEGKIPVAAGRFS